MSDSLCTPLYRHLTDDMSARAHLEGKLWLRNIIWFRQIKDEVRRDETEGRASGQINNGQWLTYTGENRSTRAIYLLCFTECSCLSQFGDYRIALSAPCELKNRMQAALPQGANVYWEKVKYSDEVGYLREPNPTEFYERYALTKPTRFKDEREHRLIVKMPPDFKITNCTLKMDIGLQSKIFRRVRE